MVSSVPLPPKVPLGAFTVSVPASVRVWPALISTVRKPSKRAPPLIFAVDDASEKVPVVNSMVPPLPAMLPVAPNWPPPVNWSVPDLATTVPVFTRNALIALVPTPAVFSSRPALMKVPSLENGMPKSPVMFQVPVVAAVAMVAVLWMPKLPVWMTVPVSRQMAVPPTLPAFAVTVPVVISAPLPSNPLAVLKVLTPAMVSVLPAPILKSANPSISTPPSNFAVAAASANVPALRSTVPPLPATLPAAAN